MWRGGGWRGNKKSHLVQTPDVLLLTELLITSLYPITNVNLYLRKMLHTDRPKQITTLWYHSEPNVP